VPEFSDHLEEVVKVHRFDDIAICSEQVALVDVLFLAGGSKDDDGNEFGAVVVLNDTEYVDAIHFG